MEYFAPCTSWEHEENFKDLNSLGSQGGASQTRFLFLISTDKTDYIYPMADAATVCPSVRKSVSHLLNLVTTTPPKHVDGLS